MKNAGYLRNRKELQPVAPEEPHWKAEFGIFPYVPEVILLSVWFQKIIYNNDKTDFLLYCSPDIIFECSSHLRRSEASVIADFETSEVE